MPIYAYRCEDCGFAKDTLQKVSDAPLTQCPACNKATFKKQVTAAGFQLKGTGWYVTDFRGGNGAKSTTSAEPSNGSANGSNAAGDAAGSTATPAAPATATSTASSAASASSAAPPTPPASS